LSPEIDLDHLSKDRRDWLEVFGNQWAPTKIMPGTCEACVYGAGEHVAGCTYIDARIEVAFARLQAKGWPRYDVNPELCMDRAGELLDELEALHLRR
jgi:hypothetical protein